MPNCKGQERGGGWRGGAGGGAGTESEGYKNAPGGKYQGFLKWKGGYKGFTQAIFAAFFLPLKMALFFAVLSDIVNVLLHPTSKILHLHSNNFSSN